MADPLKREEVAAFLHELSAICEKHRIQVVHGKDSLILETLRADRFAGYAVRFAFTKGWRLELLKRGDSIPSGMLMPTEFKHFD